MKSLMKFTWVFVSAVCAATLIACAKSNNDSNNNYYPPGYINPPYGACPNGVCGQTNQLAFYSQNSNMDQYYMNMGYSPNPEGGQMYTDYGHRNALKYAMGVCDRDHSNGGLADCNAWVNGYHDFVLSAPSLNSQTVKVVFRSYPQVNYGSWYSYSLPSFSQFLLGAFGFPMLTNNYRVYNPMILNMTVHPYNSSQGFELRGYGPQYSAASGLLFQIQVPQGKLENRVINYQMFFNGEAMAAGSFVRCATLNCGLPFAL